MELRVFVPERRRMAPEQPGLPPPGGCHPKNQAEETRDRDEDQAPARLDDSAVPIEDELLDRRGPEGRSQPVGEVDVAEGGARHHQAEPDEEQDLGPELGPEHFTETDRVEPQVLGVNRDEQSHRNRQHAERCQCDEERLAPARELRPRQRRSGAAVARTKGAALRTGERHADLAMSCPVRVTGAGGAAVPSTYRTGRRPEPIAVRQDDGTMNTMHQPPRLYALVRTADLLASEPALAHTLGLPSTPDADALTAVEQESLPTGTPLDEWLAEIGWPAEVIGCALSQEVLTLPPSVEADLPSGADSAAWAAGHPLRREVRMVVGVLRDGSRSATLRVRATTPDPDHPDDVVTGPDLVPRLADALAATLL